VWGDPDEVPGAACIAPGEPLVVGADAAVDGEYVAGGPLMSPGPGNSVLVNGAEGVVHDEHPPDET